MDNELANEQLLIGGPSTDLSVWNGYVRLFNFDTASNTWIASGNQLPDESGNNIKWGWYGAAVSILTDTAVVGAPHRDPNPPHNISWDGAAFIYKLTGSSWSTTEIIGEPGENVGTSVSQITTLIAVGAPFHENASGIDYGGVYMYERASAGNPWSVATSVEDVLEAVLPFEEFGDSVALFTDQASDDWLVVGAPAGDKVYVFKRGPFGFGTAFDVLSPNDASSNSKFGDSVTITETTDSQGVTDLWIFVAAPHDDAGPQAENIGLVEIFRLNEINSQWDFVESIKAPDSRSNGFFGTSLDASGNQVAIGSFQAYSCKLGGTLPPANGAGYVLNYDGISWSVVTAMNKLISREGFGALGTGIAIDGGMVAAGAPSGINGGQVLTYTTLLNASIDCAGSEIGPDALEFCSGDVSQLDCNNNYILDSCEIFDDPSKDWNLDGVLDECEIATDPTLDCNGNDHLDEEDIANGTSNDCLGNGIPDECEALEGLFITFIIDGSDSSGNFYFQDQIDAIKDVLCTQTTYSDIPLMVSVIQFSTNSLLKSEIDPMFVDAGTMDPICNLLDGIGYQNGDFTYLKDALIMAQDQFRSVGPSFARTLIVLTDGDILDWDDVTFPDDESGVITEAVVLRTMTPPVRICTAMIPKPPNTDCMSNDPVDIANLKLIANEEDQQQTLPYPDQPQGYFSCLNVPAELNPLCVNGLTVNDPLDPYGDPNGWLLINDCNLNGLPDYKNDPGQTPEYDCDICDADIWNSNATPPEFGNDGEVNVSDLLLVINMWDQSNGPYSTYGDITCDGIVDVNDLLRVIGSWGVCGEPPMPMPQTVQDCLNRFSLGSLGLEKCLELVEYLQNQGN